MGAVFMLADSISVSSLSIRAVGGTIVAILFLLLIAALFKRNNELKRIIFILMVAMILFASTFLFMTALNHIQDGTSIVSMATGVKQNE